LQGDSHQNLFLKNVAFQPECKINMHASCLKKKVIDAGIIACFLECAESPYLWKGAGVGQTMFII